MERKKNERVGLEDCSRRPKRRVMKVHFLENQKFFIFKNHGARPAQGGFITPASEAQGQRPRTANAARSVTATFICGIMINQLEQATLDNPLRVFF